MKDILEVKSEIMPLRTQNLSDVHIDRDTFYVHVMDKGLTGLQDVFLNYFKAVKLRPQLISLLVKDAIIYNHPTVLDSLLNMIYPEPCDRLAVSRSECCSLCDILKRPDCQKVLHKHGMVLGKKFEKSQRKKVLFDLARPDLPYCFEFKDEIKRCLKKIPYVQRSFIRHLVSKNVHLNPSMLEMFLEFNLFTDKNRIPKRLLVTFKLAVLDLLNSRQSRETAKLVTENNLDLDIPENYLDYDIPDTDTILENALKTDSESFLNPTIAVFEHGFQTDMKEHGRFRHEGADFALNFTAPFLLECGLSTTREVLEKHLEQPLHPMEHGYLRDYIQENFDGPKPLTKMCRNVLRKHFQGLTIHKFLDVSHCPKRIKDFILMKYLLH